MRSVILALIICFLFSCKNESQEKQVLSKKELSLKQVKVIKGFDTPEAIIWNAEEKVFYVSNNAKNNREIENEGFISKLGPDGSFIEKHWIDSLAEPEGMAIFDGKLFVASKTELLSIDVSKGAILKKYTLDKNNTDLNDLVKYKNSLLISDGSCNCIFRLKNDSLEKIYNKLKEPDGMAVRNDSLFVVNSKSSSLNFVDFEKKTDSVLTENLGFADGITPFRDGFFVSDWEGGLFYINSKWQRKRLTDTRKKRINTSDIWFNPKTNKLYVPTLYGDKILIFKPEFKAIPKQTKSQKSVAISG